MPSILDMVCGDLAPTLTYARRSYVFIPSSGDEEDHRDGTLTIIVQKSRRAGAVQESDTYAIQRVDQQGTNRMGFYLFNETDPEQADVYHCRPSEAVIPAMIGCTCTAGNCKVSSGCKHRDALDAIIKLGMLDPPAPTVERHYVCAVSDGVKRLVLGPYATAEEAKANLDRGLNVAMATGEAWAWDGTYSMTTTTKFHQSIFGQ